MKIHIFLVLTFTVACSSSKPVQHAKSWHEMDDFHMLMAELYHPFKDSANLQPVKKHYQELSKATDAWVTSASREQISNDKVKSKILQLKQDVAQLIEMVEGGADNEIGNSLEKLHVTFHEVQSMWYTQHSEKAPDHEEKNK